MCHRGRRGGEGRVGWRPGEWMGGESGSRGLITPQPPPPWQLALVLAVAVAVAVAVARVVEVVVERALEREVARVMVRVVRKANKREEYKDPTVYFSMIVSSEVPPMDIIDRTTHKWARLNGVHLQVKESSSSAARQWLHSTRY